MKEDVEELCSKTLRNISKDRTNAAELLEGVKKELEAGDKSDHTMLGPIASKYIDAMQKSNEQLIKLVSILFKEENKELEDNELSEDDVESMLEEIKDNKDA